ncbi:hypothetical protein Back11_63000 [Paenibacillus baekrokdamisoli]|uniref:Uncharacterized protein n=1 Tax=Paenibacillus baekrokdamisoli TaxID=1712516 RepID=A0A3G9J9C8_9BACL|nr:hypothetical protein [Paenibacillus baekrokdamisoli]MBB3069471.1 hypothetical protein [Paenibacillus baekrokdamisoli]BBH24955.1 hypothetical protein Back11_63000 [Paenibacillus baekrokdamisoli]
MNNSQLDNNPMKLPEAHLQWEGGAPYFCIDGEKHVPLVLFVNTDMDLNTSKEEVGAEIAYARREGVKFVSMIFSFPWPGSDEETRTWLLNHMEAWLDFIIDIYPEAYLFPRIWLGPSVAQIQQTPEWDNECVQHANGMSSPVLSVNSEIWRSGIGGAIREGIAYFESHPRIAPRIIGYHLTYGTAGEWFHYAYREFGSDVSQPNKEAFSRWLISKYGSQENWVQAWNGESMDDSGNPIIYQQPDIAGKPFLSTDADRPMIDFAQFSSEHMADRLIEAAEVVKRVTDGQRLVMAFYGYPFELNDGHSGHLALDRVLAAQEIDILASPISYLDRGLGGSASFMAAVDSVALHHKLWMIEDDTRTHRAEKSEFDESFGTLMPTVELASETHKRNLGAGIVHRTGLWWMDLPSKGWLNDSALWDNIGNMQRFYKQYWETAKPLAPEVAFIIDEKSMHYTGQGLAVNGPLLYMQRLSLYRAGFSYGLYMLEDAVNLRIPQAKMYVFLNAHRLDDRQRSGIERLQQSGGTFVWIYGTDFIDVEEAGSITGFHLQKKYGMTHAGSVSIGAEVGQPWEELAGQSLTIGIPNVPSLLSDQLLPHETFDIPYYTVQPGDGVQAIGHYETDGHSIAIAARDCGTWKSVFVGTGVLDVRLLRSIAAYAEAHIYMDSDDVLHTDGTFLCIYASSAGLKNLRLPDKRIVRDALINETLGEAADCYAFEMYKGEARWLLIE